MVYTDSFKAKMVQRLSPPNAITAMSLSKEVEVSQSQLSRWLRDARSTVVQMAKDQPSDRVVQASGSVRSAAEKLRIVTAAAALDPAELGAFLRREGVHEAELEQWRTTVLEGLEGGGASASARSGEGRRIKELERELRRKDKALAEAAALLVLQKNFHTYLAERDKDTDEENEK